MHPVFILCQSESCPWIQEMDETDVKTLLDELCASGRYDCIITDIDLDLNPKVEKKY